LGIAASTKPPATMTIRGDKDELAATFDLGSKLFGGGLQLVPSLSAVADVTAWARQLRGSPSREGYHRWLRQSWS
jgi:hypothetical protein